MKAIIAGSREVTDLNVVFRAVFESKFFPISTVISGGARGVDTLGELWAQHYGVMVERCPAEWVLHGKKAGFIRNEDMARRADALVAVWDGKSKGTLDMIRRGIKHNLKVFIWRSDLGQAQPVSEIPPA